MSAADKAIQREYYRKTASQYDEMHVFDKGEHALALALLAALIDYHGIKSVLDIGSGTGRALLAIKSKCPGTIVVGIEPSRELREQGYKKGLSTLELFDGDAHALPFEDGAYDLVCEFGVLHHLPDPRSAVREMLRVARIGIFISDSNNFGQGGFVARSIKQTLHALKLWPLADLIKTRGKGYSISEGDGLAYSYSVFSDYAEIAKQCSRIHMFNTIGNGPNLYRNAAHVALLALK